MPQVDPAVILVAIFSAALFTIALVHMIRSKATPADTSLSDALTARGFAPERKLFSTVLLEESSPLTGVLLSCGLHVLFLMGAPLMPYLFPDRLPVDFRRYSVRIVEFRIPVPLLYAGPERPKAASAPQRRAARARIHKPATRPRLAKWTPPAVKRPRLELPVAAGSKAKDVIIQPDQPPEVSMIAPRPLPTAFLWAQGPAPVELSRLVGAPPAPPLPAFSFPRAAPAVKRPNREVAISDLQIGSAPAITLNAPKLPVPPANISPVRMPPQAIEAPGQLPASALPPGSPMNLIAIMSMPAPPAPGYLIDPGNRLPESPPATSNAPAAAKSENASSTKPAETGNAAGQAAAQAPKTAAVDQTPESNSPARPQADAPSVRAARRASDSPAPNRGSERPADAPAGAIPSTPAPAKGTHADLLTATATGPNAPPATPSGNAAEISRPPVARAYPPGSLGVIIVQQSSQDTVLEGGDVLTGHPVYTVYFDVPGAPRRWILQYCLPGSTATRSYETSADGVIRILPKRSIQPPFPIERIPVEVKGAVGAIKRLVVYALVDEQGRTENVRVIRGTGQEIDGTAVATLKRWAFRPATRGDTPVAVEALFGIPLE
jgi:TonB family protein